MNHKQLLFQEEIVKIADFDYLLYLPDEYDEDAGPYPLVLFLHGAGQRGEDFPKVHEFGPPKKIKEGHEFPFVLLVPQCPEYSNWTTEKESVLALMDRIIKTHRIDEDRIYLTGISMGGYGTWELAMERPNQFAAIAPICGGGVPERTKLLTDIPVWVFHGTKDTIVPVQQSRVMVEALKIKGGNVRYTEYPEATHDAWTETCDNPGFYEWLLSQKRGSYQLDLIDRNAISKAFLFYPISIIWRNFAFSVENIGVGR